MLNRARTRFSTLVRVLPLVAAALAIVTVPADARGHHRRGHGGFMPAGLTDPEKDAAVIEDGATGKIL